MNHFSLGLLKENTGANHWSMWVKPQALKRQLYSLYRWGELTKWNSECVSAKLSCCGHWWFCYSWLVEVNVHIHALKWEITFVKICRKLVKDKSAKTIRRHRTKEFSSGARNILTDVHWQVARHMLWLHQNRKRAQKNKKNGVTNPWNWRH